MKVCYAMEIEFVDKYDVENNNYIANFIVRSLKEDGIGIFDSGYLLDNKLFRIRFSSNPDILPYMDIKQKLVTCFKQNLSSIDVYKDVEKDTKLVYQWERNLDNPFRKAIEDEYPCNVPNNSSFALYMKSKIVCDLIIERLKEEIGCDLVKFSDTSFVCNYNKNKHNPLIYIKGLEDYIIVHR